MWFLVSERNYKMEEKLNTKQYYYPIEVNSESREFLKSKGIDLSESKLYRYGNKNIKAILVPCSEEEYRATHRDIWREAKREQRLNEYSEKRNITRCSLDNLIDEYDIHPLGEDGRDLVENLIKEDQTSKLKISMQLLNEEEKELIRYKFYEEKTEMEISKLIGVSQKTVNNRLRKIYMKLKEEFKDF